MTVPTSNAASAQSRVLPGTTEQSRRKMRAPTPSLLGTFEFKVYYLVYLVVVPNMFYTMYRASSPNRPEYEGYERELAPGWMLGRKVDLSDGQWATFRSHLPTFAASMLLYVALNYLLRMTVVRKVSSEFLRTPALIRGFLPTLWFPFLFATVFAVALSGTSIVFILALTFGNYLLAKQLGGRQWAPALFWIYNLAVLFANEHYKGYEFGRMMESLAWLDEWRGVLRRWDVTFNITMLRMVSFAMDYHWRVCQERVTSVQQIDAMAAASPKSDKDRVEHSCFAQDYCFANYWAYLLYPPLYLTGPIISYNSFISQMRYPSPAITLKSTLTYGIRLLASTLLMELVLHTVYSVAISKWGQWETFSVYEISLFGYMRLTFIWLKLLIIWRFARFWAMADRVDTVENMRRCMSHNYSLQQFWRDWHCSYNKWLVRYVYIPLGGRKTSSWNTFVVFTFVALWHDLTMRLLEWAWIIALLFLPEGLATWYFGKPRWTRKPYFRFICSLGGALNIIAMMIANLVGFGDEGVVKMLSKIFSRSGLLFLTVTYVLLNVHLQVMFELREYEYRREYAAHEAEAAQWEMSSAGGRSAGASNPSAPADIESTGSGSSSPSPRTESLTKRTAATSKPMQSSLNP
ncbi:glycerol transporter [Coemansia thaxteri]|uniref:Glycerol transporter n=1 Tax=Coemansia thaxteri TaxID=2663907 RepID=A0A9W8EKD5_9FUNG|nr:glycerol transporter [Coemansia thaxteri]